MNKGKRIGRIMLCLVVSLMMVMTMIPSLPTGMAFAAAGDTPPHTKNITDNQDGTYTISLDIVGESEKKPNNVNVIVIMDTSGSMTTQRLNAAKNAVNSLANALYAYNTQSEPNTVEMALVQFATSSSIAQQPTNSQTTFTGAVNRLGNAQGQGNGGTNWESALQTANDVSFNDNDQTFVVFVSDGNPTFRTTQNGWNDWSNQYQQWGTGAETTQNIQRCYTTAVDDAVTLATKVTPANFFTIGAFGNVDRMEQLTDDAGSDSSTNYYSAQNTAALNQAIADILAKIEMAGFAEAEIDDGTTSTVTQSSGEVSHLLVVDESSYNYYRTGGDHGTMEPWTDAPEAELVDGTVVWDLSEEGVLENGVRYTVTFDCYPSQETYDIIAQLKNGDITYASLDSEIKKYIVDNGGGSYSLRTNTNAGIKWDDTRDDEGRQESAYINPDPVATDSETLTATKEWEGGDPDVDELDITVLMDDDPFHTATISGDTDWSTESFISIGIIKNGQVLPGAEGHDFKFAELGGEQYHWELETPTVHPMLIDGTKTMLIMVDEKHEAPSDADTYTIDGKTYYADTSAAGLTAVNHRRSNLNLTKAVTGEDAPEDAMFPFELTVNNSLKPDSAPSEKDDPDHESDWWVWLSVRDENGQGVTGLNMGSGVVEDSGGYYYAPSGTTWSLEIGAGWSLRFLNLPSGSTYTFAEGELEDGFVFTSSVLTQGEDSTFSGAQTTKGTIENTKTSYAVKYTNDYALTDLEITKVWDDNDDQDGMRLTADELKAKLTLSPAVEGKEPTVVDNGDNTYTITYTALPRYNNGQEVTYTVAESAIDGYETTGSPAQDHGTITNSHTPEVTEITVTKAWDDASNQDGKRPDSLTLTLNGVPEGTTVPTPTITKNGNNWTYTWSGLPKYADGEEIEYTVTEENVPEGYTCTTTTVNAGGTITNSYTPEQTTVTATKAWDDASNQDGKRPEELELTLNSTPALTTVPEPTIAKNGNNWTYTWSGLPKYADGTEIVYTVSEENVPEGYTKSPADPVASGGTITNSYTPETTEIDVEKIWVGPAGDAVTVTLYADDEPTDKTLVLNAQNQWKGTFEDLPVYADGEEIEYSVVEEGVSGVDATKYTTTITGDAENGFTITNTNTEKVEVTATKVWDDADDQDGVRPETLTLTLNSTPAQTSVPEPAITKSADGNSWTYTWTQLPKYADDGTEYTYTVSEDTVPEGYTKSPENPVSSGGTITNSYTPEVTTASVTKVWDDADDQDGIRPESIVITLLADGVETETTVMLTEANEWTYTVSGLDKYKAGVEIVYSWIEKSIPEGYTCETPTAAAGGTITNSHTPEQTEASVKKVWDDADNQDGFRPDDLTVKLLADGEDTGKTVTLSESNNWTATIDELDKFAAGAEISYTWDEGTIAEYTLTKTEKDATITTLTNTHTPEKVVVEVEKVWDDADNQDGIRPGSVTIKLLADGEDTEKTVTLNAGNEWKDKFEDLDKYAAGKEIEYTVEEVVPEGYEADVTGNASEASEAIGYIVTNVHEPELIEITVLKVWEDVDDQDGFRPDDVTINLLADGKDTGKTVSLTEANQWTNTFTDLYKYAVGKEGVEVVYTIDESEVPEGYEVAIAGTVEDGFTVTNSHTPEVVEVSVEKVWDDADDRDGIRPDSVTVTLLADGDDVTQEGIEATVELNEDNDWSYTWEGLNKRAAGQEISYTVVEDPVPDDYEVEYTGDAENGFTIKNFHLAEPVPVMIDPPVKKVVKGNPSKDETFTFQMTAKTEGAPMPEGAKDGVMTMEIVGSGEKEFGEAWFNEAGTYVYEITEVDGKVANYTYDTTVYTLTVEVKEVADGTQVKLVKTETVTGGNGQIVFTNTYEEPPVKTGDTTIVVPYIVIGVAALILLIMLLFRTRKNRA